MQKKLTSLWTLSVLLVFLTGCGTQSSPVVPAPTQTPVAPAQGPIRIGLTVAQSGRLAQTASLYKSGYEIAAEVINAKGGVKGRKLELVIYDDATEAEKSVALYKRLVDSDKVDLLIGPIGSDLVLAAATVAEQAKIPMLNTGGTAPSIYQQGYTYLFGVAPTTAGYPTGAIQIAKAKGYKTIATMAAADSFAKSVVASAVSQAKEAGLQVVDSVEFPPNSADYTAILSKIKAAKPDVLVIGSYLDALVEITSQMKQVDFMPQMVYSSGGAGAPEFWEMMKINGNYFIGSTQWEPTLPTPGANELTTAYKAKYNKDPSYYTATAYGAVQLYVQAIEATGGVDREKIAQWLRTTTATTAYGKYKVDEKTGQQQGAAVYLVQWVNGKKEIVWPDEFSTAKPQLPVPAWKGR